MADRFAQDFRFEQKEKQRDTQLPLQVAADARPGEEKAAIAAAVGGTSLAPFKAPSRDRLDIKFRRGRGKSSGRVCTKIAGA